MHKVNFRAGAVELGHATMESQDIELLGTEKLVEIHIKHNNLPDMPDVDEAIFDSANLSFKSMIGLNRRCYYIIDEYFLNPSEPNQPPKPPSVLRERGVGSIIEKEGKTFLQRVMPLVWYDAEGEEYLLDGAAHVQFGEGEYIIVGSIIPPTYAEALITPNSVIASTVECDPTPVELEESSLLGRKDGFVQSIDMDELFEMIGDRFFSHDSKSQKQWNLKVRHLRLERKNAALIAPVLRAMPVYTDKKKPPEVQGSIIYNAESNCLECCDGTQWRALAWKDD